MKQYISMWSLLVFLTLSSQLTHSQADRTQGSVISNYGATYAITDTDIATDLETPFKALFDLSSAPEDPSEMNKGIETVARFLNMHAEAGKPREQLMVAAVFHGNASYGLLNNEAYKEKYGVNNPNLGLLQALLDAGVPLLLCGQTAMHRDITAERRIPNIQVALSTMTVMMQMEQQGYTIINFN